MTGVGTLAPGATRVITVTLTPGTAHPASEAGPPGTEDDQGHVVALISDDQHWPDPARYLIDYR